ncbi:MATE family efflux transporter DinF [Escherichia coli]|nr:MATE family efflux transporter DinF [Escherichia coli]
MPPGVAVCFSSLFIRLVCMAFLTSSDKALWHLALPMIFSNITVPLLGLVDTAVIGHLDSPVYLGGVAVGATATSFLFMLLLFLRMSTTGLTAQAYGAKNPQALARAPVILLVVGNILNIVLDVWLVMGLHMNVQGAALATVIAEYATLLIGLLMVRKILKLRGISGEMLKTAWRGNFRRLLALNRDIMLRSLLLQLCFGAITVLGARLGSDIIAVNAVLMTLLTFIAYALDGFAYAVEAHSGQAYGARDGSQLLDVWRAACRQSGIVALLFSVVYLLAGEHIIALLTSLTQIQQLADRYLIWQVILPLVGVWCYLLDGMFIGATRAAEMRNSMAVAAAGFALTLLTLPWLGNHALWLALTVFLALRGLSLATIWRRHWRNGTWFAAT